jgi:hypothetical protein
MTTSQLSAGERSTLRQFLVDRFSLSELKDLAFDLGLDYELFPHQTKGDLGREMLAYFERTAAVSSLVAQMIRRRPDEPMAQLLARLEPRPPRVKVEIVLKDERLANRHDLLSELAKLLGLAAEEVMLIAAAPGSLRLLVSLPHEPASRLLDLQPDHIGPKFEVLSITAFEELPPEVQDEWRRAAAKGKPVGLVGPAGGLSGLMLTPGFLLALGIALGGFAILALFAATPRVEVVNECTIALGGSTDVPILGTISVELPAEGSRRYPIPPGSYSFLYDGRAILVRVPIAGEIGPFEASGDLNVTYDGQGLPVGVWLDAWVGLGDRPQIVLCPRGR